MRDRDFIAVLEEIHRKANIAPEGYAMGYEGLKAALLAIQKMTDAAIAELRRPRP